jgi:hypothetical protein
MKRKIAVTALVGGVLALVSLAGSPQGMGQGGGQGGGQGSAQGQQTGGTRSYDRDRQQDRDRMDVPDQDRDQDRDRDRLHAPGSTALSDRDIYGHELMSDQERNEYRRQIQSARSVEEREEIRSRHQADIQARAMARGVSVAPASEGPLYGGSLMTAQERNEYREQMRMAGSDAERSKLTTQHREEMLARAKAKGVVVDE